jgi:predicted transcriptional regulator YdeE
METSLITCGEDLARLWRRFEENRDEFHRAFGFRRDFYGLMWLTQNGRYCYLIGPEIGTVNGIPVGAVCKQIPPAEYAVLHVPADRPAFDAWTEYYEKILPEAGYVPNKAHGIDFEYYPNGGGEDYELWTPLMERA